MKLQLFLFLKGFLLRLIERVFCSCLKKQKQLEINKTKQIFYKIKFLILICKLAFSFTYKLLFGCIYKYIYKLSVFDKDNHIYNLKHVWWYLRSKLNNHKVTENVTK